MAIHRHTPDGTARELVPISEQVLAWVVSHRLSGVNGIHEDDLRRIELCALATREASMFFDLYGDRHAPAQEVPE